jgi:hypothetical protein
MLIAVIRVPTISAVCISKEVVDQNYAINEPIVDTSTPKYCEKWTIKRSNLERWAKKVYARCKDLVRTHTHGAEHCQPAWAEYVIFIHQTVVKFLDKEQTARELRTNAGDFDLHLSNIRLSWWLLTKCAYSTNLKIPTQPVRWIDVSMYSCLRHIHAMSFKDHVSETCFHQILDLICEHFWHRLGSRQSVKTRHEILDFNEEFLNQELDLDLRKIKFGVEMSLSSYVKARWHEKVDERLQARDIAILAFALLNSNYVE